MNSLNEAGGKVDYDTGAIMGGLYGDGIIACKGAFSKEWVARLKEDIETLFAQAQARPGGALERGPCRYYVEVHPERIRGFVDLVTHPWVVAVCRAVLGPDYKVVEAGFDIPFPGAMHQPWHRDFPSPEATLAGPSTSPPSTSPRRSARSRSRPAPNGTTWPAATRCSRPRNCIRATRRGPSASCRKSATSRRVRR
jgi:hypothetical protein